MLIHPSALYWFMTNKHPDHKTFKRNLKMLGEKIPDSIYKNIENSYKGKRQTETTKNLIKEYVTGLLPENIDKNTIDTTNIFDLLILSYGFSGSFLDYELTNVRQISPSKFNDLSHILDINNDVIINIENINPDYGSFSLNTLLYFLACFDIINDEFRYLSIKKIINRIAADIKNDQIQSSFYYYINFWIENNDREGKKITDTKIAEKLNMNEETFSRYKTNNRDLVNTVEIASIQQHSGYIYHTIHFINNFLLKMKEIGIFEDIKPIIETKYPLLHNAATSRFKKFKKLSQANL